MGRCQWLCWFCNEDVHLQEQGWLACCMELSMSVCCFVLPRCGFSLSLFGNHVPCMQPASHRDSHTHPHLAQTQHTTSIATKSAPYTRHITTSALALQSQHRNVPCMGSTYCARTEDSLLHHSTAKQTLQRSTASGSCGFHLLHVIRAQEASCSQGICSTCAWSGGKANIVCSGCWHP